MHILLVHQAFAALNEPGGTRHHEIALYLVSQGHQVTIITSPVSYLTGEAAVGGVDVTENGVRIIRPPVYRALHRSFVHRVINFLSFMISSFVAGLRVKNVDLVWGTSPPIFQGVTAWLLARVKRVPFLFEIRDLWPAFAVAVGVLTNPWLIRASEWLERFLYRRADQLMVNSPGFIAHIQHRGGDEIELVPNGVDVDMFDPSDEGPDFRTEHGLGDKFVALYAGAHGMSNDLDVVLDAANLLRENPKVAIVFVGDGKEKPGLEKQAEILGLENIYFVPSIPKIQMSGALAAADACIAILKPIEMYKTVYPNKVFDYMAAGRPVILAMAGVIREVVEKAGAGISVPSGDAQKLADAIRFLAENQPQGQIWGQNGRDYVVRYFDRTRLADKLMSIMEKLITAG